MKERFISGVIIAIICIPIIIFGGALYALGIGILAMLAYKEIIELKIFDNKIPLFVKILGIFSLIIMIFSSYLTNNYNYIMYYNLLIPIIFLMLPMLFFSAKSYNSNEAFSLMGIIIFLGLAFCSLLYARLDIYIFIYLISITVFSDIFAYVTGMLIGKHKLCPEISPKKSIEGSIGGLIVGVAIPILIYINFIGDFSLTLVATTLILAIFSQLGDLIFSKIKRDNKIKDFSNLIPGHGGILDRLDSLLIVALLYLMLGTFI